jgi:hypothetical protein
MFPGSGRQMSKAFAELRCLLLQFIPKTASELSRGADVARKCLPRDAGAEDFLSATSGNRRVNGSSAYLRVHVRYRMLRVGASN